MCRWSSRGERLVAAEGQKKSGYVGGPESSCKTDSFTRDGDTGGPIHPFRPDNYLMRITSLLPSFFTPLASHFAVPWPSALPAKPASDRGFQRPRLPRVRKLPADTFLRLIMSSIILRIFTFIPCHPCQWRCGVVASGQTLSLLVLLKCGVGRLDSRVPCVYIIQL